MAKQGRKKNAKSFAPRALVRMLERDAAALFSFVDSVCEVVPERRKSTQYLNPSEIFFSYIRQLADTTKAYLDTFPGTAPKDPRLFQSFRQKLETIRLSWFEFHQFIKAAADADTLSIPHSLVETLTKRLNLVRGFAKTRFAIFHSDELNYFQVRVSAMKETADKLKSIIPNQPPFPENLGLIGIPYSQSSSLYLNCLISHEMGHFVFQRSDIRDKLLPAIESALKRTLGAQLSATGPADLTWSKDRLAAWAEELFCDLFAIWLTGPCYSFSYVELFGLTTNIDPSARSGFNVTDKSVIFWRNHPADLFRIKQHVFLLQELGWWNEIKTIKSHYIQVLTSAVAIDEASLQVHTLDKQPAYANSTLQAFLLLPPRIRELLVEVMRDADGKELECGVAHYKKFARLILEYLSEAVVPSSVFDGKDHRYPNTVSLLNASMRFYLESLEELMNGIEHQNTSLASHRSRWIKKIESLTGKAIEDHYLLVGEKGALESGGSFKRANLQAARPAGN
jgi:hypothetical protein